ncbi:type I restriction endonuclease subunit R, partial [Polycyclovorans algicola]|uniref:type I restriction endonuclease subunit R n=1 Tax=Polycyclovorans algicola TaxID=616992 RepID=UPI0004A6F7C7
MNENHLESACLEWLSESGWECLTGDDVSAGGSQEARSKYAEVVLVARLRPAIQRLNPTASPAAIDDAIVKLMFFAAQSLTEGNRDFYGWIREGVPVDITAADGTPQQMRLQLIDWNGNNDALAVQQFTVHGAKVRRPDVVLFVNGLPLVVLELKNPADEKADTEKAYADLQTYKREIPQLFYANLLNVISDGTVARYGSLTADFERHGPWRLLADGQKAPGGALELEVMCRGLLHPKTLLSFLRGFVAFSGESGSETTKVVAQWHQYQGVRKAVDRAVDALVHRKDGKGGVIWFTQGSGKSFLAVFYVMALRERPEFENPTVVVVTDRNDLDGQLYDTFALCSRSLRATPVQAEDREDLRDKLSAVEAGGIFFTTINKFAPEKGQNTVPVLCERSNVIVITDEAHRTQYGFTAKIDEKKGVTKYGLAKYMRDSLPNAIYLGMTGTPVSMDDRDTEAVFGSYVDVYDMIAAQEDGAVVPVSYESRIIELSFNEAERQALKEEFQDAIEDEDESEQSKAASRHTRLEALAMADGRIERLAQDLVAHWGNRKEQVDGKAMVVAISRAAAVRLYEEIIKIKPDWHSDNLNEGKVKVVMTSGKSDPESFQLHNTDKQDRKLIEKRFKKGDDPLEIVIVRDMWLTGTDAPPCHTLYIDKPMQGHGLMQAIARTNRVWKDKPGGLVVDYIGIGEELKKAIKQYTRDAKSDKEPVDTSGQALTILLDTLDVIRKEYFHGFDYSGCDDPKIALAKLGKAIEHILSLSDEKDDKGRNLAAKGYLDQVAKMTKAQALAGTRKEAMTVRDEIAFFQAVRVSIIKLTRSEGTTSKLEREAALRQLVARGVLVDGVNDVFGTLGLEKPNIGLLDERFLDQIRQMPTKNLAKELLARLLADEIKARGAKNAIQGQEFTDKLVSFNKSS